MTLYLLALLIGIIAGLRAMTAPAAASWAAALGRVSLSGSPLAFMGLSWTPWILTLAALAELVTDQLPTTPSRKIPVQFGTRIVTGALSGAVLASSQSMLVGAVLGAIGAVVGTLGGADLRARAATAFGRDLPAALIEDAIAIVGALLIVMAL